MSNFSVTHSSSSQPYNKKLNLVSHLSKKFLLPKMAEIKGDNASQTSNPLTKKLNKILETRFDNDRVSITFLDHRFKGP